VKNDDLAEVEDSAREGTGGQRAAVTVVDVNAVSAELARCPTHRPTSGVVTAQLTRHYLANGIYNKQFTSVQFSSGD